METLKTDISLTLFYKMLRIRLIEEAIGNKYSEQKMRCPVHLSIGQEAIAVGVCEHLLQSDYLVGNHRAHAHYLAKGGDLKRMMAEIYGKETGCSKGRGGSMHLIDLEAGIIGTTPIVGGSIPVGVGVAFSSLLKKENKITTIFFGEGSTEEGVWSESLNFASLKNLPVLFVCENNFYSVYSPLSVRQSEKRSRIDIAKAHGMFALDGHGNNVDEVFEVSKKAVDYVRNGNGPAIVEFDTYRYREHCGPNNDDDAGYRPDEEVKKWQAKCPLIYYEGHLRKKGLLNEANVKEMKDEIISEINEAFSFAENSPFPTFALNEMSSYATK